MRWRAVQVMGRMGWFGVMALVAAAWAEDTIRVGHTGWAREFAFDGEVWRTVRWVSGDRVIETRSDEFHLLMMDDREISLSDFVIEGEPKRVKRQGVDEVVFVYRPRKAWEEDEAGPERVEMVYQVGDREAWGRKTVRFEFAERVAVDRLEVERFSVKERTDRGGRGEPVWMDERWYAGLEYPAGYSRHGDGNQPEADGHRYELVGNYSFIDLEGRDRIPRPQEGMVRLFHFPGYAKRESGKWVVESVSAVVGGGGDRGVERQFGEYLATIQKADRSFTHYNNWFDAAGKDVSPENLVEVFRKFRGVLEAYEVKLDAMVPDDGWQDRKSVWQPSPRFYPGGMADLKRLAEGLRREGTDLGLWLALNGTNLDGGWGAAQGFRRAQPNPYLRQYFPAFSLADSVYKDRLREQLERLAGDVGVCYFKHDFNHLSDLSDGCGHPPTDRHGHEANVNGMLEMLAVTRRANPAVYQNLTNWVWFSPWWLMHGDALWMLAGDDGANGNWPELSVRAMATTDRDVYLWRMWGDPKDRPLVPVSRLMTHGIVLNPQRQLEGEGDGVREWADHVMMYYGRGVQMKEWYISPQAASEGHWRALMTIHRWAEAHFECLKSMQWYGGRPDEGHVYGYAGSDGKELVAVVRNPAVRSQKWRFSLPEAWHGRWKNGERVRGRVVYPYRGWVEACVVGRGEIEIDVAGYHTLAIEWDETEIGAAEAAVTAVGVTEAGEGWRVEVPGDVVGRADLLVIGYPAMPVVRVDGVVVMPRLVSKARLQAFAGYARRGMLSDRARPWVMAAIDLKPWVGKVVELKFEGGDEWISGEVEGTYEAWMLLDRRGSDGVLGFEGSLPWAVDAGMRRQTVEVVGERDLPGVKVEKRRLTEEDRRKVSRLVLAVDVFGVNGVEYGVKEVWVNGKRGGTLPPVGDRWESRVMELEADGLGALGEENVIEVRLGRLDDKFKVRNWQLGLQRSDGLWVVSERVKEVRTAGMDWVHAEGEGFEGGGKRLRVVVPFR